MARTSLPGHCSLPVHTCAALALTAVLAALSAAAAPLFTSTPPTRVVVGRGYAYDVQTTGLVVDDPRMVSAPGLPPWLTLSPRSGGKARLKGKPGVADAGTHAVTLTVTDGAGHTAQQVFEITVLLPPVAPPLVAPRGSRKLPLPVEVTLTTPEPGATIRYSTDGSVPTAATGQLYTAPLPLSRHTVLTAVACVPGHADSRPVRATYAFAPAAQTTGLAAAGSGTATLGGEADTCGLATEAWFEWSTVPSLSKAQRTQARLLAPGAAAVPVEEPLAGLVPGRLYYYSLVARNAAGTTRSAVDSFAVEPLDEAALVVNSAADTAAPPPGKLSLRAAVDRVAADGVIAFDPLLNGRTLELTIVGEPDSILRGERFTMAAGKWVFEGYPERNYGASALYAAKSLTLDAGALPEGIVLHWAGAPDTPARLLAVRGNLSMRKVAVTGGRAVAEPIVGDPAQPFTLGRGGGVAVWGIATLDQCVLADNRAEGDISPSRDRGAFGGGIYADVVHLRDCVVSGNAATGYGAAGGGVYSVGGVALWTDGSTLDRCTVSGNRVTAQHAYGGGVYSDGGGPGNDRRLTLRDSTLARNQVEDRADIADSPMAQYYYRGGGVYMSNGSLAIGGCTIVENDVTGTPATFSNKPNMGGGGVAATIGNAHVVETINVWHSIIAGNRVGGQASDLYTGSLIEFYSGGYNRIGVLDFSQILVPIPAWMYLSRRHWPKAGDREGVLLADVLDLGSARFHDTIVSQGADAGGPVVLWYPPRGDALDQVPPAPYTVPVVWAGYTPRSDTEPDDFLNQVLAALRADYGTVLGADFGLAFGDLTGVTWGGEAETWPADPQNVPWITFWHDLDTALAGRLGAVGLGDEFWDHFTSGPLGDNVLLTVTPGDTGPYAPSAADQLNRPRAKGGRGEIGALEAPAP